jgi:hypothetical protein
LDQETKQLNELLSVVPADERRHEPDRASGTLLLSFLSGRRGQLRRSVPPSADLGYRTSGEALSLAEESGDIFLKPFAYFSHSVSWYHKKYIYEADKLLLESIGLARKIDHFVLEDLAKWYLGEIYFDMAKHQESYDNHTEAASILELGSIHPVHRHFFQEYGADGWVKRTEGKLAQL